MAIVGIGAIFPGAPDPEQFWNIIASGTSTAREVPSGRWLLPADKVFDRTVGKADRVYSRTGCFIETPLSALDTSGLALEPGILENLDPLYHLLLHAGKQAFRDAVTDGLDRRRVGIIIGNLALPSEHSSSLSRSILGETLAEKVRGAGNPPSILPFSRFVTGMPAGVLATALGLGGTCSTLDAACASSLYAIKMAVDELTSGRADAMLTGGISRPDPLYTQMGFSQLRALSPSGVCSPFDARGDGLVVGEGAGILVLKRTADALRDGDNIYGVIRGIGVSNDVGGSLLAPSSEGQLRAMRAAYGQAGWRPSDVDVIECHATGTPVGDAVEFSSLKTLWQEEQWRSGQCVLGSVKSNIGHTLTAAGSAAVIKTLLALKQGKLPPTANFATPAPGIDLENSPFRVLTTCEEWPSRNATPRRAAVSAFGFGGINAHLLLEEWPGSKQTQVNETLELATAGDESSGNVSPIAIVGMDARVGPWQDLRQFRHRVLGGRQDDRPERPRHWWGVNRSSWYRKGTGTDHAGYFIDRLELPASQFRIPPKEMEEMLPQQALILQSAAAALTDARLGRSEDCRCGVFIGLSLDPNTTNFTLRWWMDDKAREWAKQTGLSLTPEDMEKWVDSLRDAASPPLTANRTMGALASIAASRIAREFRIGGPSFTISAEENSGLRALEAAVRALQKGELDRAVAGAVDLAGDVRAVLGTAAFDAFFDRNVSGKDAERITGDGAATVVLKRLEDAERDGDKIYAIIREIGTASGGIGSNPEASAGRATAAAFTKGNVETVGYVELSGFAPAALVPQTEGNSGKSPVAAGFTPTAIGSCGAVSGLASLIRSALCLHHEILPSGPPEKAAKDTPTVSPRYWLHNRAEGPRRASVCSASRDGSVTHLLLEESDKKVLAAEELDRPLGAAEEALFVITGADAATLMAAASHLQTFVSSAPDGHIDSLATRWFAEGKDITGQLCAAFVPRSTAELTEQVSFLRESLSNAPDERIGGGDSPLPPALRDRVFYSPQPLGATGKVAFVYPGSGSHFAGMGRELSVRWPQVYREQHRRNLYLRDQFQPDAFWTDTLPEGIDDNHNTMIFGQVSLGTAVSDIVRQFGVRPEAVISYSLGESAGLFSLGAWTDRDLMLRRMMESELFTHDLAGECRAARAVWGLPPEEPVEWTLGVVGCPATEVRKALAGLEQVYLLIVNTPDESVIGGNRPAVESLVKVLGCRFFPVKGVTTVHCGVARPVSEQYHDLHLFPATPPGGVTFYSGAWGRSYDVTTETAAASILAQALDGIDFPRVIEAAYDDGVRLFLEMGPGGSCSRMIGSILAGRPHIARPVCVAGQDAVSGVLRLLAQLLAEKVPVDLAPLYPATLPSEGIAPDQPKVVLVPGGQPFAVTIPEPARPQATVAVSPPQPPASATGTVATPPVSDAPSVAVQVLASLDATRDAHETFLRFSSQVTETMARALSWELEMLGSVGDDVILAAPATAAPAKTVTPPAPSPVAFDREQCLQFAIGSVSAMLGPDFAEADTFPTRVRLPDEPLMLVDRIVTVEGEPRSMTKGRVVTEHDVLPGAWYLDGGRIPTCIAVEAGQADLFLSGYLGIDFITRGLAVYRLLDAVVTFHGPLPKPGETIRYDIRIERFFRQDRTYLFRFNFDGTVNGKPLLTMRDGCAGFFTEEELAAGKGIVHTKLDLRPLPGKRPADWCDPVSMDVEAYDSVQLDALRRGDLAGCFGPLFARLPISIPLTIPSGTMKLVDRVVRIDPTGGRFGIGLIRAEADIEPTAWFLTCHFVDDRVMPGTLMYECCMHTLRIFLLRMGWVGEAAETVCEPVPEVASQLKCRGQVTETTRTVTYEVSLKEVGYRPEPYVIVDALMYADGKPIVEITNMSAQLSGLTREKIEGMWHGPAPRPLSPVPRTPLFDYDRILAFAIGKPSEAFGDPYRIFDEERVIARLPGPPFQFLDRVVAIDAEPWQMKAGGSIIAEYDVPPDAWYFAANRSRLMPFSVLLEIALQPCGWLAAYIGSALTSPIDLRFRNLGGTAVQLLPVTPETGTLSIAVKITRVATSGGMVIQNYDLTVSCASGIVYRGDTVFGFFSAEALSQQVGVRDAAQWAPSPEEEAKGTRFPFPTAQPFPDTMLRMIGDVECFLPEGGPHGLGYIRGTKVVDPSEWFFKAHFYQDPVCPGSLGLESFLQLLKVAAYRRWNGGPAAEFETVSLERKHTWTYRGQIIPSNNLVTIEAVITAVDNKTRTITANGFLSVDGKIIYQMEGFTARLS